MESTEAELSNSGLPLPIQTFLWRQTSPFLNPRLSKHCEATCMSFERILVQNIHQDLSPSISDALTTISRWQFLKSAFPYVMHCCAAIIKNFSDSFSTYESKMLYTMHWLILDAASECDVSAMDSVHHLSSLQLFVYLFTPLLHRIDKRHFDSLKLEQGLKLWQPLWDYQQPRISSMCSPVKYSTADVIRDGDDSQSNQSNIYFGVEFEQTSAYSKERDSTKATYFDVAVLQCLMNTKWSSKGVVWALSYLQRRLDEIIESQSTSITFDKSRSSSMPLPTIEVSMAGNSGKPEKDDDDLFVPASSKDDDLFIPASRVTEESLLKNKRQKTQSHGRSAGSRRRTKSENTKPALPPNLVSSEEDSLADIEEEQEKTTSHGPNTGRTALGPSKIPAPTLYENKLRADQDVRLKTPTVNIIPPSVALEPSSGENVSRSRSVPDIVQITKDIADEAPGSTYYIEDDGSIKLSVILKATSLVMVNCKEQDISIQALKVVDKVLHLYDTSDCPVKDKSPENNIKKLDKDNYNIAADAVVRCVVNLGCPTCTHLSSPSISSSRYQTCMVLHTLQKISKERFSRFFHDFAEQRTLDEIVDFFHSYMNFCTHGNSRSLADKPSFNTGQSGFSTNFGHSISGEGHRGVEGIIIAKTLKIFVTRLSMTLADATLSDNVRLYHNSRKFLNYTQDVHGGTFRRVAFSGLIDTAKKLKEEEAKRSSADSGLSKKLQQQLSRTLSRNNSMPGRKAMSDTEMADDSETENKGRLKPGKNPRSAKSDAEESCTDEEDGKNKLSFQAVTHATLAIVRARRKFKEHIKMSTRQSQKSSSDAGRRLSDLCLQRPLKNEIHEKKMVDLYLIRSGMLRFNLLMSVSQPGLLPEPEFLAALLELDAPVSSRACLLLECAYFVHQCTQGEWPSWMHTYASLSARSATYKRTVILQRTAAAMFYRWAEALGLKLASIMDKECSDVFSVIDDSRKKIERHEEDFLDEASINPKGLKRFCPHALKIVASLLLLEITTFLREVYQHMAVVHSSYQKPLHSLRHSRRTSSTAGSDRQSGIGPPSPSPENPSAQAANVTGTKKPRRWALVSANIGKLKKDPASTTRLQRVSLMGGYDMRASGIFGSTTSINSANFEPIMRKASGGMPRTKKLSAVNSSFGSSTPAIRSTRSIKLKSRDHGSKTQKTSTSTAPSVPLETSFPDEPVFPDDSAPPTDDTAIYSELYEDLYNKLNWLTPIIKLASASNFICDHVGSCHQYCFKRQSHSCQLLTKAITTIYSVDIHSEKQDATFVPPMVNLDGKRPSVTKLPKSSSQILLTNVVEATIGKRRSFDKTILSGSMKASKKQKEILPIISYLKRHEKSMMSIPLAILLKSAAVLSDDELTNAAAIAWEFLLQTDKETIACAASLLLVVAGQVPQTFLNLVTSELNHPLAECRISAVRRFHVLWSYRYQVWSRLETGAQSWFKAVQMSHQKGGSNLLIPPSIDYTLPSPPIGLPGQLVPDPPWMPLYKLKLEELAANQESSKSLVTATNTRRKQQQEMVAKALVEEEGRKREAREAFPLNTIPISIHAAQEFTQTNQQELDESADEVVEVAPVREIITAHFVFPSSVCLMGLNLLDLLEDSDAYGGTTVSTTAEMVIWNCMIEDPALFFRYLFEKLTNIEKRNDMFRILRKLLIWSPNLPSFTAYTLLNNLVGMDRLDRHGPSGQYQFVGQVGYLLFYNRSANSSGQVCMSQALSIIWQLVPSVQGLYFKDLKTMLKKVQSEQLLMITAHLPSTKKVIVHGPDTTLPPQQFLVHEETQFKAVLQESLDYFQIAENLDHYQLVDAKTGYMYSEHSFVRDFYVFRRNSTPQLKLVKVSPEKSSQTLQKLCIDLKFIETSKVELSKNILKFSSQSHLENQVLFLHEEFSKQVAFPRKALETEFSYYKYPLGTELYGTDVMHKLSWLEFLNTMFRSMPGTFGWTNEMRLFLNVINGCFLIHCEDDGMLRICIALYLNISHHFKQVFASEGFLLITPTIIKVYNTHLNYPTIKSAIMFLHKQFYELHRRAYLLQFLGSYEPFITSSETKENRQILSEQLYELLHSLEKQEEDTLGVLSLIWNNQRLKTLDFCYDEDEEYKMIDAINTAITVVAYHTESYRSTQMLIILEAIIPWYMKSIVKSQQQNIFKDKMQAATEEIMLYSKLSQSIRALIHSSEALMKALTWGHHRLLEGVSSLPGLRRDVDDPPISPRSLEEGNQEHEGAEIRMREQRLDFERPRDALLGLVSEFFTTCLARLDVLKPHLPESLKITPAYFIDSKSHERLEEVANALLKIGTYDAETMSCRGLQRYIQEILPEGDWSQESMKPAINIITKRLERIFVKVHKRANVRALADWDALATLLRGICLTLESQPTLHHLAHMKILVNSCISIVLEYGPGVEAGVTERWNVLPNHIFCSMVAKLAAQHAAILGETGGIEQLCGGSAPTAEKTEMMLANFIIPLCLRIGGNEREKHILPQTDIRFILCLVLSSLVPYSTYIEMLKPRQPEQQFAIHIPHHIGPHTNHSSHHTSDLLKKLAFLGLKTLLVCCETQIYHLLPIIAQGIIEIGQKTPGIDTWEFFEYLVTVRTTLYPLIKPFIITMLLSKRPDQESELRVQTAIRQKVNSIPSHIHRTKLLEDFAGELDSLRKDLMKSLSSGDMIRTASVSVNQSNARRRFSTWRKSSLISKIHQTDHLHQAKSDQPYTVANISTVKAQPSYQCKDETDSTHSSYQFTRNPTSKGSRYGSKNPLKHIQASEGAKLILDKFNNNHPQLPADSNVAVNVSAGTVTLEQSTSEERLAKPGRKGAGVQLIRQPHVIFEEEPITQPAYESNNLQPSANSDNVVIDHPLTADACSDTSADTTQERDKFTSLPKNHTYPRTARPLNYLQQPDNMSRKGLSLHRRPAVIKRVSRANTRDHKHALTRSNASIHDDDDNDDESRSHYHPDPLEIIDGDGKGQLVITQADVKVMEPSEPIVANIDVIQPNIALDRHTNGTKSPLRKRIPSQQQRETIAHQGQPLETSPCQDENECDEETTPLLQIGGQSKRLSCKNQISFASPSRTPQLASANNSKLAAQSLHSPQIYRAEVISPNDVSVSLGASLNIGQDTTHSLRHISFKSLKKKDDSERIALVSDENCPTSTDSIYGLSTRSATASSAQTMQTSIDSSLSFDDLPYIDASSSSDE